MSGIRRANFDYGNTRLRARRGALRSRADYERLLSEDIDGVLRELQGTRYAPQAETMGRGGRLQALHLTVRPSPT
jgi:vacuolar-type H+-ATPase subunit C/Vma6